MKLLILLSALVALMSGCSFGKGSNHDREIENRRELEENCATVQGIYKGTLDTLSMDMTVACLTSYSDKKNEDGEPIQTVSMKIYLEFPETIYAPEVMDARYYRETGELIGADKSKDGATTLNLRGRILGDTFNGEYSTAGQTVPVANAIKKTGTLSQNGFTYDPDEPYYARLRRHLANITGNYAATIEVLDPADRDPKARLSTLILEMDENISGVKPTISARFTLYEDIGVSTDGKITYQPEIRKGNNISITFPKYKLIGRVDNNSMNLIVYTAKGRFGRFTATAR